MMRIPWNREKSPISIEEEKLNSTTEARFFLQSTLASFSNFIISMRDCWVYPDLGRHDLKVEGDFGGKTSNLTTTPPSKLLPW